MSPKYGRPIARGLVVFGCYHPLLTKYSVSTSHAPSSIPGPGDTGVTKDKHPCPQGTRILMGEIDSTEIVKHTARQRSGGGGHHLGTLGSHQGGCQGVGMPALLDLKARAGLMAVVTDESPPERQ